MSETSYIYSLCYNHDVLRLCLRLEAMFSPVLWSWSPPSLVIRQDNSNVSTGLEAWAAQGRTNQGVFETTVYGNPKDTDSDVCNRDLTLHRDTALLVKQTKRANGDKTPPRDILKPCSSPQRKAEFGKV